MSEDNNYSFGDLNSCDKEPVRFIASIQDHAALFCFSNSDYRIHNFSENISKLFGESDVLHKRLNEFGFGRLVVEKFEEISKSSSWENTSEAYIKIHFEGQIFETHFFTIKGLICAEVECLNWFSIADNVKYNTDQDLSGAVSFSNFKSSVDISSIGKELCSQIRKLTGLDRVMLYKFSQEDWHGKVIAEDKVTSAHSFLGHRFPATDIPKPARDLYLKNKVRYIASSHAVSSQITPINNAATNSIIDLSSSKTRAVSPIHLEYLKNMGVKTSYSVAVIVNDYLWGLIACHASEVVYVGQDARQSSEILAEAFSLTIPLIESNYELSGQVGFADSLLKLTLQITNVRDPLKELLKNNSNILKLFNSTGFAIVNGGEVSLTGFTPPKSKLIELADVLSKSPETKSNGIFSSSSLGEINNEWIGFSEIASGVLAFSIGKSFVMFFRKELISTVVWGGDPQKLNNRNYQGRINPRESFQSWEEVVKHHSDVWKNNEIEGALKFKMLIEELNNSVPFTL